MAFISSPVNSPRNSIKINSISDNDDSILFQDNNNNENGGGVGGVGGNASTAGDNRQKMEELTGKIAEVGAKLQTLNQLKKEAASQEEFDKAL